MSNILKIFNDKLYVIFFFCRKKLKIKEKTFEMRWAQPEEFTELIVMPRMLLDHLPENLGKVLNRLAEQQKNLSQNIDL